VGRQRGHDEGSGATCAARWVLCEQGMRAGASKAAPAYVRRVWVCAPSVERRERARERAVKTRHSLYALGGLANAHAGCGVRRRRGARRAHCRIYKREQIRSRHENGAERTGTRRTSAPRSSSRARLIVEREVASPSASSSASSTCMRSCALRASASLRLSTRIAAACSTARCRGVGVSRRAREKDEPRTRNSTSSASMGVRARSWPHGRARGGDARRGVRNQPVASESRVDVD
jgi:hypothetical protein